MLRHFCILCAAACSLWVAVIALLVGACSEDGGGSGGGGKADGTVKLFLGKLQVPMFDSISVNVSAADMATIHISKKSLDDNLKIEGIPQGENRKFEVKIYADSGILVQEGEASVAEIKAGETIAIQIPLRALVGFLKLEIPLGITNYTGVDSGKLYIDDSWVFDMKIENGKGIFSTNSLPLNKGLNLKIELRDANGTLLFTGSKNINLSSISQTETIQLESAQSSVILELIASSEGPMQILAMLPESAHRKRTPQNYGDIFFTEIYANPASTEDDYFQYMELYNSTSDTLQLLSKSCKIVRTDNGVKNDIENLTIPPMSYAIIGRSKVLDKDYSCGSFALLKTEMSLGLFCGNLAIDTLTYSSKGDNKFPFGKGTAMQLPLANYETRTLGSSWCAGFSPREDAICP